jgi:hypothetical protein
MVRSPVTADIGWVKGTNGTHGTIVEPSEHKVVVPLN